MKVFWEIFPVRGESFCIVLRDDSPVISSDGRPLVFYREIDAKRFIKEQKTEEGA